MHSNCVVSQQTDQTIWLTLMNETHVWLLMPYIGLFFLAHVWLLLPGMSLFCWQKLLLEEDEMKDFITERSEIIRLLGSDNDKGLSLSQVELNRQKYGLNVLEKKQTKSLFVRIWEASTEPMLLMLIGAGIIALGVNIFRYVSRQEADFLECVGIFLAIALSVLISVVMEGRSAKAFEALSKINENTVVKAVRNGNILMLNQQEIVVGDILLLAAGDKIPADGRLLESNELFVDESMLTGESLSVQKNAAACFADEKTPLAERANMLYKGTFITSGDCKMIVTAVGSLTEFGIIAGSLSGNENYQTPLQEKLSRLGKNITLLGIIAAVIVFVAQIISFALHDELLLEEIIDAFVTSIVLIVAAVPEGLPTIVAVSLSINIIKLAKNNALVKKMIASETVGCINVICSDKTGTLTENKMKVCAFYDGKLHRDCSGLSNVHFIRNICINSTADLGTEGQFIGNPTECAILQFYEEARKGWENRKSYREERVRYPVIKSFPFNSDLKHMSTIAEIDEATIVFTKGSPEMILSMCAVTEEQRKEIEQHIILLQQQAMRIIAFSHKRLIDRQDYEIESNHKAMESEMVFDGFVAIADPLRKEVFTAVKMCEMSGIELKILTGDNIVTATAIATELNLLKENKIAVEAKDIEEMSDEELSRTLDSICVIARSTPGIKMRIVQLLKAKGNVVAVTGDGINDAPALKNADVGIAMGITGTEVSKEAGDIVLLDDSFATIVKAVEWGRNIYENFKRFISFQLTVNFASVVVVFVSILLGLKAPFTALELLWINIIMDGPPALTLGLEPNYRDLMKRKPTGRNEDIISKTMLWRIVLTGSYISIVFLCQYIFNFLEAQPGEQGTVLFTLFVFFQLFNSFNCRELHSESILKHLFCNKIMLWVMSATFVLQIVFIQFAGVFFGTVPLETTMWLKLFATAFSVVIISEIVKMVYRFKVQNSKSNGVAKIFGY